MVTGGLDSEALDHYYATHFYKLSTQKWETVCCSFRTRPVSLPFNQTSILIDIHISRHLARGQFKSQPTQSRLTYLVPLKKPGLLIFNIPLKGHF